MAVVFTYNKCLCVLSRYLSPRVQIVVPEKKIYIKKRKRYIKTCRSGDGGVGIHNVKAWVDIGWGKGCVYSALTRVRAGVCRFYIQCAGVGWG